MVVLLAGLVKLNMFWLLQIVYLNEVTILCQVLPIVRSVCSLLFKVINS